MRGVFVLDLAAALGFIGPLTRGLIARHPVIGGAPPGGLTIAHGRRVLRGPPHGRAAALTAGGGLPYHYVSAPVTERLPAIVRG